MSNKNSTREWVADLLSEFAGQENTLTINRAYITITGSIDTALLLSQIVYWSDRTKMANGWFAKSYSEWEDELTLSEYQVRKATKALSEAGVETKLKHFNGVPTLHYRLNRITFSEWILKKLQNRPLKNFRMESEETSEPLTEPTTEPITDTPARGAASSNIAKWGALQLNAYYSDHTTILDALLLLTGIDVAFVHWCEMDLTQQRSYCRIVDTFLSKGVSYDEYEKWLQEEFAWRKPPRITLKDFSENVPRYRTSVHSAKSENLLEKAGIKDVV